MKRTAIYVRVSTQDQSNDIQKFELKRYCELRGFESPQIYEDKATGTNTDRAQFQEMLRNARQRHFDILIIWKLDRFARSLKDLITHLNELTELGIEFISVKDNIDLTTSAGRLMVHLLASFAEFEASLIKERVKAGIESAQRKGTKFGRPRTTDVIKVIALRNQGLSMGAISKHLGISKTSVHKTLSENLVEKSVTNTETIGPGVSFRKE